MSKRKRSRGKRSPAGGGPRAETAAARTPARSIPDKLLGGRFLPVLLLALMAFLVYANAWPDSLAGDDANFAIAERYLVLGTGDVWRITVGSATEEVRLPP